MKKTIEEFVNLVQSDSGKEVELVPSHNGTRHYAYYNYKDSPYFITTESVPEKEKLIEILEENGLSVKNK